MGNGKQNNRTGWAEGFLSWEKSSSPANDLLWEKLNQKLQVGQQKKKMNLLWAAAILFLIAVSFIFWNHQFKNGKENAKLFKKESPLLRDAPLSEIKETGITIVNNPAKQEIKIKKTHKIPAAPMVPMVDSDLIARSVPTVIIDSPQITTINPVSPKKKIRVVHMNEWFSPPPPTYATSKEENELPYTPSIWPGKHRGLSPPSSNN